MLGGPKFLSRAIRSPELKLQQAVYLDRVDGNELHGHDGAAINDLIKFQPWKPQSFKCWIGAKQTGQIMRI